jgi:thiol-disulfide isomerase/thioredoxin
VTSQSPATANERPSDDYKNAWASLLLLVRNEGLSWSGRERNRVFLSMGAKEFSDVSAVTTADFIEDGRAIAKCDWNNDGAIDLLLRNRNGPRLRMLQNNLQHNNWLQVKLVGNGTSVNRDAIGTKVIAHTATAKHTQILSAGDGYLNQSSKTLFFGIGDASEITKVEITWPDGTTQIAASAINQQILVTQGVTQAAPQQPKATQLAAGEWEAITDKDVWRIPLVSRLPVGVLPIPSQDAPARTIADLGGLPILLNFWSTTCAACLEELDELSKAKSKLNRFGLQVVPMITEGHESDPLAVKLMDAFGFQKLDGTATPEVAEIMQVIVNEILGENTATPLPFSLLIDSRGNLIAIYFGKVQVQGLLRDLRLERKLSPTSPDLSMLSFGSRLAFRDRSFNSLAGEFLKLKRETLAKYYLSLDGRFEPGQK